MKQIKRRSKQIFTLIAFIITNRWKDSDNKIFYIVYEKQENFMIRTTKYFLLILLNTTVIIFIVHLENAFECPPSKKDKMKHRNREKWVKKWIHLIWMNWKETLYGISLINISSCYNSFKYFNINDWDWAVYQIRPIERIKWCFM